MHVKKNIPHKFRMVFVVLTIKTGDSSDEFILEKVASNYTEALKSKITLEFKYNTEQHPEKDHKKWEHAIQNLEGLGEDQVKLLEKETQLLADKFAESIKDPNVWNLPYYRTEIKEVTVDSTEYEPSYYGGF